MQELSHVLLFIDVAAEGSIAAAARKHDITRATASRRLKALENALGVQLLHRTNHHIRLTQAGELYFKHAASISHTLKQAETAVHELSCRPTGLLRVAIPILDTKKFLSPALWGFLDKYPDIQMEILLETDIRDMVAKGIDLAFQIGFEHNTTLKMRKLLSVRHILVASAEYVKKHGQPKTIEELHQHPALVSLGPDGEPFPWFANGTDAFLPKNVALSTNSVDLLLDSLRLGRGVGVIGALLLKEELQTGQLIHMMPEVIGWNRHFSLIHADTNIVPPKVRAFIDYIVDFVADYVNSQ